MKVSPERVRKIFIEIAKGRTLTSIKEQYGYSPSTVSGWLRNLQENLTTTIPELKHLEHDYSTIVGHIRKNKDLYLKALICVEK